MKNGFEKGYIMVPRRILSGFFSEYTCAAGYDDAYLRVWVNMNYKDMLVVYNGKKVVCRRGESLFSYVRWSEILGWTRYKTMRFFKQMYDDGLIERVQSACPTHIRLKSYDCGRPSEPTLPVELAASVESVTSAPLGGAASPGYAVSGNRGNVANAAYYASVARGAAVTPESAAGLLPPKRSKIDELFDEFWRCYHEITQVRAQCIERARRCWKRLTAEERRLAIDGIVPYYEGLENTRYCKSAVNYLADKVFLDTYPDSPSTYY